jgi:hypothetical protein
MLFSFNLCPARVLTSTVLRRVGILRDVDATKKSITDGGQVLIAKAFGTSQQPTTLLVMAARCHTTREGEPRSVSEGARALQMGCIAHVSGCCEAPYDTRESRAFQRERGCEITADGRQ